MAESQTQDSTKQKIRIRLKAYDHKVIDQASKQIIDTAIRTGAKLLVQYRFLPKLRNLLS